MSTNWWVQPEQLDADQRKVIALPIDRHQLIIGPPGCGKTNLLLLKASQIVRSKKPNVLILVFTRTLREYIVSGVSHYAFTEDKIKTFSGWMSSFLRGEGIEPETDNDFTEERRKRVRQCLKHVEDRKLKPLFEAILIDESQDCLPEEVELFSRLGEVLYVVADSRQKIYDTGDAIERWKEIIPENQTFILQFHYRNGETICRLADAISKGEEKLLNNSNYNEKQNPSSVDRYEESSLDEQVDALVERLTDQLKAYPGELIGVVAPRNEELNQIVSKLSQSELAGSCIFDAKENRDGSPFDDEKCICVCSIHDAKGLEFRSLHILGSEFLKKFRLQRNMAYTAVTRAKTSLCIYHTDTLSPFLESALNSLEEPGEQAPLESLFTGGLPNVE